MKFRTLLAAPLALTLALTVTACGGQTGATGGSSAPSLSANAQSINAKARDQIADGGELKLEIGSLADNWNPMNVDGNESDVLLKLNRGSACAGTRGSVNAATVKATRIARRRRAASMKTPKRLPALAHCRGFNYPCPWVRSSDRRRRKSQSPSPVPI